MGGCCGLRSQGARPPHVPRALPGARDSRRAQEELFLPRLRRNSHYHGLFRDAEFSERYRYARAWRRNDGYYIVLYEARSR